MKKLFKQRSLRGNLSVGALLALCLAMLSTAIVYADIQVDEASPTETNQQQSYIVILETNTLSVNAEINVQDVSAQLVDKYSGTLNYTYESALQGFAADLTADGAAALAQEPGVAQVVPDGPVELFASQNPATWGLDRVDQTDLPLDNTYNYEQDGSNVHVYIIDTGIRPSHNEFGSRVGTGYESIGDGNGTNDCNGHGTHVAGTVGGSTYGLVKATNLYPVRVLDCGGSGTWSGVIAGIDWVTANYQSPAVANMSLGGGGNDALDLAIQNSINAGVTYVVAAGNDNANACNYSPARAVNAVTVGSTTSSDARSSFSNFGTCVDIFGPGSSITSAWHTSDTATNTISGTSMASPHVAGAAALYLAQNPSASPASVTSALVNSATPNRVSNVGTGSPNLLLYVEPQQEPSGPDAQIYIDASPITMTVGMTYTLRVMVSPDTSSVNGVQVNATVDADYLEILDVQNNTSALPMVLEAVSFDASTGTFRYGAGLLNGTVNTTFEVLQVLVRAITFTNGTPVTFLLNDFPPTDISGLSGSVMEEAQNGTVIISPPSTMAELAGEIGLQGRPNGSSASKSVPVDIQIFAAGSSSPLTSFSATTDQDARFVQGNIPPGTYDIQMVNNHTLVSRVENVVLNTGANAVYLGPLMEGDTIQDNEIRVADFGFLSGAYNLCSTDSGFEDQTDLNEDGCTDSNDFGLFSGNYNTQGNITYDVSNPPPLPIEVANAKITFDASTRLAGVHEVFTLPLFIDPAGSKVNGASVHLLFDPSLLDVVDVELFNDTLSTVLEESQIDRENGIVRFGSGLLGNTVDQRFQLANITVRLKGKTDGTSLRFSNDFPATNVTGTQGTVLQSREGIVLATSENEGVSIENDSQAGGSLMYLPLIIQ